MSIKLAVPEKTVMHLKPRISVIGVGGRKIQLGLETTQGLGAGARPEIGKLAAEEAKEEIEKELEGANMVFITAGMGGGTGSGAAPVVAQLAKSKGILTVGVVTKPFQFEGRKRLETAEAAVEEFTKQVDSIIIIPNQNLFRIADKNTTLADAFVMADNVLYAGVRSITDLMMMPGLINLDFADIKSIMEDKGKAIMGTGEAEGEDRAVKAAEQALSNPLLDDCSMHGAKGVLINITGGQDITLFEIDEAASRIKEEVDEDANIIFGSSFDESLAGKIRVSIVATGIGENVARQVQNKPLIKPSYIEESYSTETIITPNEELDSNLEKFSATKTEVAEEPAETITKAEIISIEQEASAPAEETLQASASDEKIEDFDSLESSSAMSEMPKASSLFKAIINKNEDINAEAQLESILSSNENNFTAKTSLRTVEEEPELFPNHNPAPFSVRKIEEPEQLIVNEDEEEYTPTLIERVTGFSIAKRNRKKLKEHEQKYQEPVSPSFSDDEYREEDRLNLEIPSFLRRSK